VNVNNTESGKLEVDCQFCKTALVLQLAAKASPAWRMFDCPQCRKTNFVTLAAQIVAATLRQN
jgi:hypothetical protein